MSAAPAPPDQAARHRIEHDLGSTLFVEAGAGSGKTTALVGRVVALITSGTVELRQVAAITFTEKAGAELRDRVRRALQEKAAAGGPEAERCRVALAQLDGAAIGTLHSFAQRLLSEHPVEARLPPRVEVLDEVSSAVAFDRRWTRILDQLLEDPELERTILLLHAANVDPGKLRSLALAFERSWDLVEDLVPDQCADPPRVADLMPKIHAELGALAELSGQCIDQTDKLLLAVHEFGQFAEVLTAAGADDLDLLEALGGLPGYRKNSGKAPSWRGCKDAVLAQLAVVVETVEAVRRTVLDGCAHRLGTALRAKTLEAAEQRRAAGTLEFHDLLVLARKVLRDPEQGPVVRAALHERYQRLLLDEFQDTDPIQIELAVRIAALDPLEADAPRWADVEVEPGRLFVVGDPKQSIYRFRRADISVFMAARERFAPAPEGAVELTANFRTVAPVIDWVNATFRTLLEEPADTEVPYPSQPAYIDLQPQRAVGGIGAPVAVIGTEPHPYGSGADTVRIGREPRRRQRHHRSAQRGVGRARGRRWLAPVPPRRHHHPRSRAHLAPVPRGRPGGGPHPLPGRVELTRVRHARRPRPPHGAARRRRPHRPPPHRQRAPHPAPRLRRRRPVPPQGARRPHLVVQHPHPTRPRRRDRLRRPGVPARDPREPPVALAERAPRPHRP